MMHLENRPGLISMLAGKPNSSTFPITSLQFTVRDPNLPSESDGEIKVELSPEEVAAALQYSPTVGMPGMCEWAFGLQEQQHGRKKGEGWRVSIGAGSQDLLNKVSWDVIPLWTTNELKELEKAIDALVDPGDAILIEAPCYA